MISLEIKPGLFAVLRDGTVPEEALQPYEWDDARPGDCILEVGDGVVWSEDGTARGRRGAQDIVSVHATRAEALAYVADNPMNRELYPDGPDLAPAPVVVDWQARAEALEAVLAEAERLLRVAVGGCDANDGWSHSPTSLPYDKRYIFCQRCGETMTAAQAKRHASAAAEADMDAILAAAKEPRHG